jgi:acetyl-CoA carboxylase biotin carboxyl carrier protein
MAQIKLKADINGAVWKLIAQPGDKLEPGGTVMVIESMKMEIPVIAEEGGTVVSIAVKEGDAVASGQVVAVLEA